MGVGGHLPGELLVPESEDEVDTRRTQRGVHDGRSPQKRSMTEDKQSSSDGTVTLSMEALRSLFAQQAAIISETQRTTLNEVVASLRHDLEGHRAEVRQEVQLAVQKVEGVDARLEQLMQRVDKLEKFEKSGVQKANEGASDDSKHLCTLIYGGWPPESARKDILGQLDETLQKLRLKDLCDNTPFTTGPRKSMALQSFAQRKNESFSGMRARMQTIVSTISNTEGRVGTEGRVMFAMFSKPKEVRERGDHSAWVRRALGGLHPDQERHLEVEYNSGGAWLHRKKIASALDRSASSPTLCTTRTCGAPVD